MNYYYITFGKFQKYLKEYYDKTGNRLQFREMIQYLYRNGCLSSEPFPGIAPTQMFDDIPESELNRLIDSLAFTVNIGPADPTHVMEVDIIPTNRDVFIIRHPRYTRQLLHIHNYFELNYVCSGKCVFAFEDNMREIREGEVCIIAPGSKHDVIINDESTVFCIMLRKSTFNKTFFSLLSRDNLLAQFFRTCMTSGRPEANYLLFSCPCGKWARQILFNAMAESYKDDAYSNSACISWLRQFFTYLLRNDAKAIELYDYQMGAEFTVILQYIQDNYRKLTLAALAEEFHYSEPYLSTLVKQNTGKNFTELVKGLRLSEATDYLKNTNMKVNEIAELVGYHSPDHFSRLFRSHYKVSPQTFRRRHREENEPLNPFKEET